MAASTTVNRLSPGAKVGLVVGAIALMLALANGSFALGIVGVAALAGVGWTIFTPGRVKAELQPRPLPPDLRELAEALARGCDPDLGPVTPAEVIPIAEQTGLIVALGRHVLYEAGNDP